MRITVQALVAVTKIATKATKNTKEEQVLFVNFVCRVVQTNICHERSDGRHFGSRELFSL